MLRNCSARQSRYVKDHEDAPRVYDEQGEAGFTLLPRGIHCLLRNTLSASCTTYATATGATSQNCAESGILKKRSPFPSGLMS